MSGGRTDLRLLDSDWGGRLRQVPGGEIKQTFSHFQQKIMWQWHGPQCVLLDMNLQYHALGLRFCCLQALECPYPLVLAPVSMGGCLRIEWQGVSK